MVMKYYIYIGNRQYFTCVARRSKTDGHQWYRLTKITGRGEGWSTESAGFEFFSKLFDDPNGFKHKLLWYE